MTRMGRPRTARDGGLRKARLIRFSDGEWEKLERAAEAAGCSRAELVRRRCLRVQGRAYQDLLDLIGLPAEAPNATHP